MSKNIILTGDRPTGRLHIGHYVGSLRERVRLQEEGNYDKMFIMIADTQALTDNSGTPQKIKDNIIEVMLDYLAVGLDPSKVTFFVQSGISALPELTCYYMNLVTLPRLLRNPTVKSEIKYRGFDNEARGVPVGFANYPISQAADITAFKANLVPVGDDQLPMIEQTKEIVRSFNNTYNTEVLVDPKAVLPKNEVCLRLPGTDGSAKMSKSLNNSIYLSDDSKTVKEKVMSMYTDPNHIKVEDPGQVEGNMVFTYLDVFASDEQIQKYSEFSSLQEMKDKYQQGGLGDVKIKKVLYEIIEEVLTPFREKRKYYEEHMDEVRKILHDGTMKAREAAHKTLMEVKNAININYFNE